MGRSFLHLGRKRNYFSFIVSSFVFSPLANNVFNVLPLDLVLAQQSPSDGSEPMRQQLFAELQALHQQSFQKTVGASDSEQLYRFAWAQTTTTERETAASSKTDSRCEQLHEHILAELATTEGIVFEHQELEVKGFETVAWLMEMSSDVDSEPPGAPPRMAVEVPASLTGSVSTSADEGEQATEDEIPRTSAAPAASSSGSPSRLAMVKPDYSILFGPIKAMMEQLSGFLSRVTYFLMIFKHCFASSVRNLLHSVFRYWRTGWMSFLDLQFWMADLGMYSNSNSPKKHFSAVLKVVESSRKVVEELITKLQPALIDSRHHWGHDAEKGMFTNTTLLYRDLFPETALIDKGVLRVVLQELGVAFVQDTVRQTTEAGEDIFDEQSDSDSDYSTKVRIFDFGAMDGGYSRWLNDTGIFVAHAVEGSPNVNEISGGTVHAADLTQDLRKQLPGWLAEEDGLLAAERTSTPVSSTSKQFVLCIEVAEHIPPGEREAEFLANLNNFAKDGLIISWAPPHILGEGHVNTLPPAESRRRLEALGLKLDERITRRLRAKSELSWVRESIAFYRRE
ncbi:unnamed protein product [Amoebophrya sp. A120]|nr:unnamed protein product [Amoebophrya sp. A120]|eukprot:GSA120T00016660001.1